MAPKRPSPRPRIIQTYSTKTPTTTAMQSTQSYCKTTRFGKLYELVDGASDINEARNTLEPYRLKQVPGGFIPANHSAEVPKNRTPIGNKDKTQASLDAAILVGDKLNGGRDPDVKIIKERTPEEKASRLIAYNLMKINTARQMSLTQARQQRREHQDFQRPEETSLLAAKGKLTFESNARREARIDEMQDSTASIEFLRQQQYQGGSTVGPKLQTENRSLEDGEARDGTAPAKPQESVQVQCSAPLQSIGVNHKPKELLVSSTSQESESLEDCLRRMRTTPRVSTATDVQADRADAESTCHQGPIEEYWNKLNSDQDIELGRKLVASEEMEDQNIIDAKQDVLANQKVKLDQYIETDELPLINGWVLATETTSRSTSVLSENERDVLNIGTRMTAPPASHQINTPRIRKCSRDDSDGCLALQEDLYNDPSQESGMLDEGEILERSTRRRRRSPSPVDRDTHAQTKRNYPSLTGANNQNLHTTNVKKMPRELPTESLVLVGEQVEYLDSDSEDEPMELPDDPISQVSENPKCSKRRKVRREDNIKVAPRLKVFPNDYNEYRMPERESLSPKSRRRRQQESYGDGFSADEAQPIGKTMPIRRPYRPPARHFSFRVKYEQLIIVAHRTSENSQDRNNCSHIPHSKAEEQREASVEHRHVHRVEDELGDVSPNIQDGTLRLLSIDHPVLASEASQTGNLYLISPNTSSFPFMKSPHTRSHRNTVAFIDELTSLESKQSIQQLKDELITSHRPNGVTELPPPKHHGSSELTCRQQLGMVPYKRKIYDSDTESDTQGSHIDEDDRETEESSGVDEQTNEEDVIRDLQSADKNQQLDKVGGFSEREQEHENHQPEYGLVIEEIGPDRVEPLQADSDRETKSLPEGLSMHSSIIEPEVKIVLKRAIEMAPSPTSVLTTSNRRHFSDWDVPFSQRITHSCERSPPSSAISNVDVGMPSLIDYPEPFSQACGAKKSASRFMTLDFDINQHNQRADVNQAFSKTAAEDNIFRYQDWKPRVPKSSQILLEVDEEIVDSPTSLRRHSGNPSASVSTSKSRQSSMRSQTLGNVRRRFSIAPLKMSRTRHQGSPELIGTSVSRSQGLFTLESTQTSGSMQSTEVDSTQFSVEHRCSQNLIHRSPPSIPETPQPKARKQQEVEAENSTPKVKMQSSHEAYEPPSSVINGHLSNIILAQEASQLPVIHISTHSCDLLPSAPRQSASSSSLIESSGPRLPQKSLANLTRQASQNMGTMVSPRYRGRTNSLHEIPHLLSGTARR